MYASITSRYPSTSSGSKVPARNVPVLSTRELAAAYVRNRNDANGRPRYMGPPTPSTSTMHPSGIKPMPLPLRRVVHREPLIIDQPMEHAPNVDEEKNVVDKRAPFPDPLKYADLPLEFKQHFSSRNFRVDMKTLNLLSRLIRGKVDYITQAANIYPLHPGFLQENLDAFQRNLEVIRQAGDYFEPMLAFEDSNVFFPNAMTAIGTALTICTQNNTAMYNQFAPQPVPLGTLYGCRLSKHGMQNLCILLNGIITEAEGMISEYDKWKSQPVINKVKMMMMTIQFSRYYRLAGIFAKSALQSVPGFENEKLADELNRSTLIKLGDESLEISDFQLEDEECYSDDEDALINTTSNSECTISDPIHPSESRSTMVSTHTVSPCSNESISASRTTSPREANGIEQ